MMPIVCYFIKTDVVQKEPSLWQSILQLHLFYSDVFKNEAKYLYASFNIFRFISFPTLPLLPT